MAKHTLPQDFKEFLKLLNESRVRYLVVGGHAVGMHGYVRYTGDLDIWISGDSDEAATLVKALQDFGFKSSSLAPSLFTKPGQIIRMGFPPLRIEIHTTISGVDFNDCYGRRQLNQVDGLDVPLISLPDLRTNKAAAGRLKDRLDLENLLE